MSTESTKEIMDCIRAASETEGLTSVSWSLEAIARALLEIVILLQEKQTKPDNYPVHGGEH